uniref:Uncharacterized protein LOC102806452 n=1 Tax=Saccoglossus kowalevskii TaxID=10224 RepID=A0ABM0MK55_SACKO|nr:PREDICTED: uncharacterized protein LOC102806452 [Saccoglossus kowalevskii]
MATASDEPGDAGNRFIDPFNALLFDVADEINHVPWNDDLSLQLADVYTKLRVAKVGKRGGFTTGEIVENSTDIFNRSVQQRTSSRRIRVEGAPAIGKSIFCRKLAYDWACGEFDQFKVVLLIELRHVRQRKIVDVIFDQLLPIDAKI